MKRARGAGRRAADATAGREVEGERVAGADARESVSRELLEQARRGDARAFERLYRLHAGWVYALCLRLVADAGEAESLTQDVFVRLWEKRDAYRGDGAFGGWLRRLTVNIVIDDRRARGARARWLTGEDPDEAAAPVGPPSIETLDLERAIAALPPGARFAFVLHDIEGYRHHEIAQLAGIATGTVKAQLHRARRLLRVALEGRGAAEVIAP
jgi:RNA polymerase sigma-70 factor, ECF subfamily